MKDTIPTVWLCGSIAAHRRGRVLQEIAGALKADSFPASPGIGVIFASDFQEETSEWRAAWLRWSQTPGCVLLLVPPFSVGPCEDPLRWEALQFNEGKAGSETRLPSILATEVRHEIQGGLQPARELGGVWINYAVNTAFYRKHPNAGLFVVTALPIWSLTLLDHAEALTEWCAGLKAMAGTVSLQQEQEESQFQLHRNHYTVLLHLISGRFGSNDAALAALGTSPFLQLKAEEAAIRLNDLIHEGMAENGRLTEQGREALRRSHYEAFASELEALAGAQ